MGVASEHRVAPGSALIGSFSSAFSGVFAWRNLAVSLRTAAAGITALAIAYVAEMQEPHWAILTVYLLTQSSTGAALSKGVYRILGTLCALVAAVTVVKLFSQDPPFLVGAAMAWMFLCYYGATRLNDFAAYGFMLAGFTGLLIIFQGAQAPAQVWSVATARAAEVSVGVGCAALANALILPAHAGAQLRAAMAGALGGLAGHSAQALRAGTATEAFLAKRRALLAQVTKFASLRSYAEFESPEMRADGPMMRETTREFLVVVAVARSLRLRLLDMEAGPRDVIRERLDPLLDEVASTLEAVAADRAIAHDPARLRATLRPLRQRLAALSRQLVDLGEALPLAARADAALVCRRTAKMLRALSMAGLARQLALGDPAEGRAGKRRGAAMPPRTEAEQTVSRHRMACLQGARAALGLLALCIFAYATEWDQMVAGVTGFALMSYQCVNADDPGKTGWPYFRAVSLACICAYLADAYVFPWLDGFVMLAAFLVLTLVPVGMLSASPRFAKSAGTFAIFFAASAIGGNVYQPDPLGLVNFCVALIFGMLVCLITARLLPVTARTQRRQAYRRALGELLPEVARGERVPDRAAREIVEMLAAILPGLALARPDHDLLLRGMLASASSAQEVGRLRLAGENPDMPEPGRAAIRRDLPVLIGRLAAIAQGRRLSRAGGEARDRALEDARDDLARMQAALSASTPAPGSAAARAAVEAAASLRFLEDRLLRDRGFLTLSFPDEPSA